MLLGLGGCLLTAVCMSWMRRGLEAQECGLQQEGWQMQQNLTRKEIVLPSDAPCVQACSGYGLDLKDSMCMWLQGPHTGSMF